MKKYKTYQTLTEFLSISGKCDALQYELSAKQEKLKSQMEKIEQRKAEATMRANAKLYRLAKNLTLTVKQLVNAYAKTFGVKLKDIKVLCESRDYSAFRPIQKEEFINKDLYVLIKSTGNQQSIRLNFPLTENTLNGRDIRNGFRFNQKMYWGLKLKRDYYIDLRIKGVDFHDLNDLPIEFVNNLIDDSISREYVEPKKAPTIE